MVLCYGFVAIVGGLSLLTLGSPYERKQILKYCVVIETIMSNLIFIFCDIKNEHAFAVVHNSLRSAGSSSPPGGNQVDGLPPAFTGFKSNFGRGCFTAGLVAVTFRTFASFGRLSAKNQRQNLLKLRINI